MTALPLQTIPKIPLGSWLASFFDWLTTNFSWFFDAVSGVIGGAVDGLVLHQYGRDRPASKVR